jgi:hypothetical protein
MLNIGFCALARKVRFRSMLQEVLLIFLGAVFLPLFCFPVDASSFSSFHSASSHDSKMSASLHDTIISFGLCLICFILHARATDFPLFSGPILRGIFQGFPIVLGWVCSRGVLFTPANRSLQAQFFQTFPPFLFPKKKLEEEEER